MFAPRNPPMCKVNDKYFLRVIGESENNVSASESNAEQLSLFFFFFPSAKFICLPYKWGGVDSWGKSGEDMLTSLIIRGKAT